MKSSIGVNVFDNDTDMETYTNYTDEELVEKINNNDLLAEEILYLRYVKVVKQIIAPFFIVGADREDLFQEGMMGLYKSIKEYNPKYLCSFKNYANVCIRRNIITAIRTSTRLKHNPLNNYISFSVLIFDDSVCYYNDMINNSCENPENIYLTKEYIADLSCIINQYLSKFEKQVLYCYLDGLSYHETSKFLKKDIKSIDNALQRSRKKLRKKIINEL